jgi:hypothetical protein
MARIQMNDSTKPGGLPGLSVSVRRIKAQGATVDIENVSRKNQKWNHQHG